MRRLFAVLAAIVVYIAVRFVGYATTGEDADFIPATIVTIATIFAMTASDIIMRGNRQ